MTSTTAFLEWHDKQPYSAEYGDVYFSSDNGLAESEYVFIQGNQLKERWQAGNNRADFTIIETGFGTGLNFCCAAQAWQEAKMAGKLQFISIEKHPLAGEAIQQALCLWPTLSSIAQALLSVYPKELLAPADHKLTFRVLPNVELTLYIGDVVEQLKCIEMHADAWFLDGFSPAKNPDMWQQSVFDAMANLSNQDTTLATFTSASAVRRGLIKAGFEMQKRTGFGKKREMLTGTWQGQHRE